MTTLTISLPDQVAAAVDHASKTGGFASRSEFIRLLIRQHLNTELHFSAFEPRPLSQIRKDLALTGKYNQQFIDSVVKGLKQSSAYAHKAP